MAEAAFELAEREAGGALAQCVGVTEGVGSAMVALPAAGRVLTQAAIATSTTWSSGMARVRPRSP